MMERDNISGRMVDVTEDERGRPVFRADCGHVVQILVGVGTGYARQADNSTVCYPCADTIDREAMRASASHVAYVDTRGEFLTTWSGGALATVTGHTISRSGWHGSEIHRWWFTDRNFDRWYGANAGTGMVITVRRIGQQS